MNTLIGLWLFTSLIYQGSSQPLPNPDLVITLDFYSATENRLKYYRKNEQGFCERTARFSFDGEYLVQEITQVNPLNADFCQTDPDMQLGRVSKNKLEVLGKNLWMHLDLGEEPIIFVWTREEP